MKKKAWYAVAFVFFASTAYAYDWSAQGNVTLVESSYMPDVVTFNINQAVSACPSGYLKWTGQGSTDQARYESSKATMALVTSAFLSGHKVEVFGTGCDLQFVHLIP